MNNIVFEIPNWKGRMVRVTRSGQQSNGRMAVIDFKDNLITGAIPGFIPLPLLQKLVRSVHEVDYFGAARDAVTSRLGFYTDLQSLASEDTITFSYLGPIWLLGSLEVAKFTDWLMRELELPVGRAGMAMMDFWRRIPHAQSGGRNGSEFDWAVVRPELLLLVENEFSGTQSSNLGVNCDLKQVEMLREYAMNWGRVFHPSVTKFVILGVTSCGRSEIAPQEDIDLGGAWVHVRNVTWQHLASYRGHPSGTEFADYYAWRIEHAELQVPEPLPAISD